MSDSDPERALALSYAPRGAAAGLAAMFALDATLGAILQSTREPLVGQMRLTWWFEALAALDGAPPPAQPVLRALADAVLPHDVTGQNMASMIDGWEALLDGEPLTAERLDLFARLRGGVLFELAGRLLGANAHDPLGAAGAGWALADLAQHVRDPVVAAQARDMAQGRLAAALEQRWSGRARALGALAHLARMDLAAPAGQLPPRGAPGRVARLAWHRLSGR